MGAEQPVLIETSRARRWTVWAVVTAALGALVVGAVDFDYGVIPLILVPGLLIGLVVAINLHLINRDAMPPREDSPGPTRGPNMSKISFSGGAGLLFTLASMAIFFVALPEVRWFLAVSLPLGIAVGVILHFAHRG